MKRRNDMYISMLRCKVCSNTFPIPRRKGRMRENKHIKTFYCPFCKEERDFVENEGGMK